MNGRRAAKRGGIAAGLLVAGGVSFVLCACSSGPSAMRLNATTLPATSRPSEVVTSAALPPPVEEAIGQLSSADESVRMRAVAQLGEFFRANAVDTDYLNQLVERIQSNIGEQLQIMMSEESPEAAAQVKRVLVYNQGLAHFAAAALDAPAGERESLLAWGFSHDQNLTGGNAGAGAAGNGQTPADLVGLAFSADPNNRAQAAKGLGAFHQPAADWILARLIDDPDRWVSLAAMNAVWERPPTAEVVDVLWNKAVVYPLEQFGYRPGANGMTVTVQVEQTKMIQVGDRTLQLQNVDTAGLGLKSADGNIATDILVAYQSPLVEKKLNAFFEEMLNSTGDPNSRNYRFYALSPGNGGESGVNIQRLIEAYRPKQAVILLAQIASSESGDGGNAIMGNQPFCYSGRIDAMGELCRLTDLDRNELKVLRRPDFGNRWVMSGRAEDEEAAAKKVREWWRVHQREYVDK